MALDDGRKRGVWKEDISSRLFSFVCNLNFTRRVQARKQKPELRINIFHFDQGGEMLPKI